MKTTIKKHAPKTPYVSCNQLKLHGFETPFEQNLNSKNRWVILSHLIPWDEICNTYLKHVGVASTGRPGLNPRIVIGSIIIKHICNLDDRETVAQISENMYMQYFLGYSSFLPEEPFDASLFVEIRKRMGQTTINSINEKILSLKTKMESREEAISEEKGGDTSHHIEKDNQQIKSEEEQKELESPEDQKEEEPVPKGRVILDATACPQDIMYPTDLDLLSKAREKSEQIIDLLYDKTLHQRKPRNYREIARRLYLQTAQKKNKSKKEIRKAIRKQLQFLKRNLHSILKLLEAYDYIPLPKKMRKYYDTIQKVYEQQKTMYDNHSHSIEDRIVSIHQPHVRPIVRGKSQAKTEFGAKIHLSFINGIVFLDELNWNAFNEGSHLKEYIEQYRIRFGFYPCEVLADKIYCTRENRNYLKEKNIKLIAKPLGRPSAVKEYVRPGARNPIEGKFGQAKTAYGMNRIKARLKDTSETWIASIILVLNLVKLAGLAFLCKILKLSKKVFQQSFVEIYYRIMNILFPTKLTWSEKDLILSQM